MFESFRVNEKEMSRSTLSQICQPTLSILAIWAFFDQIPASVALSVGAEIDRVC